MRTFGIFSFPIAQSALIGAALLTASGAAAQPPQPTAPSPVEQALANIRPQAAAGLVDWDQQPTAREIYDVYPAAALEDERGGNVSLFCIVAADRRLSECEASELPAGYGFGQAALALASKFQASASARLIGDESATLIGARVEVPIRFSYLDAMEIKNGGVSLTNAVVSRTPRSTAEVNAVLGPALVDIARRARTSDEIRAALRDLMDKEPVVSFRLERLLFEESARTDTLSIDTSVPGRLILRVMGTAGNRTLMTINLPPSAP